MSFFADFLLSSRVLSAVMTLGCFHVIVKQTYCSAIQMVFSNLNLINLYNLLYFE